MARDDVADSGVTDGGSGTDLDDADVEDLLDALEDLEDTVDSPDEREEVRETIRVARRLSRPTVMGRVISGFDRGDLAEALLGAVVFGIPMFVEEGTREVGTFTATHPAFFAFNVVAAVGLSVSILYVADIQDVRVVEPFFGIVPRRLVGVLGVSLVTALAMMTAWGRVSWAEPWLALNQVGAAYVPMALGASLGDILPGS